MVGSAFGVLGGPAPVFAAVIPPEPTNQAACGHLDPGTPVVGSFTRTPASVNVLHTSKKVTFTVKVTDSTQSIASVDLSIDGPGDSEDQDVWFHRAHGTGKDGTWIGTWLVRPGTHPGTWHLSHLEVWDEAGGNVFSSNPSQGPQELPWKSSWPKTIKVTSKWDHQAPTLTGATFKPASVDTTNQAKTVTVTVRVRDAIAGVAHVEVDIGNKSSALGANAVLKRHSGTAKDGTWTARVTIPKWSGRGKQKGFVSFSASDAVDNWGDVDAKGTLAVTSRGDPSRPAIKSVTFSPNPIDTTAADRHVTLAVHLTDTFSGVAEVMAEVTAPSGDFLDLPLTRKTGTALNGTWNARILIPQCGDPAAWTVQEIWDADAAGNRDNLDINRLRSKHLAATLTVKSLDWAAPTASVPDTVAHTGPLVVTFDEPAYWKDGTVDTTFLGLPAGTWSCKSPTGVSVACGGANLVKTASFTPTTAFAVGHTYEVSSFANIYDQYYNGPMNSDGWFTAS